MSELKPTSFDELFPGRFLKAGLLKGRDWTLTIADITVEDLPVEGSDKEKSRGVITFKETDRQVVLNRTNGECLKQMFGKQLKGWLGRRITIFPGTDHFGKDVVDCIRVRGSPDISAPVMFMLKLPHKKPRQITMQVTRGANEKEIAPVQAPKAKEDDEVTI